MSNLPVPSTKEVYSECYIKALSAACLYDTSVTKYDFDSVDIRIACGDKPKDDSILSSCGIQIQLKAYSFGDHCRLSADNKYLKVKLTQKNYDDLRKAASEPRLLVVYLLPKHKQYFFEMKEGSILFGCAFWVSLNDLPEITTESKVVDIPIGNRLDKGTMQELMYRASMGIRNLS